MNRIFPVESAYSYAVKEFGLHKNNGTVSVTGSGIVHDGMLGLLVCTDGSVIKAYSGFNRELEVRDDFAPPCFDPVKYRRLCTGFDSQSSREAWEQLKKLYEFHCIDGSVCHLSDIFPNAPGGTGDCCTVRLLNHCFGTGRKPVSMVELNSKGELVNPCDARCRPVLKYMLGLDMVYADGYIAVVNKMHGMLSIEGKTEKDCVSARIRRLYSNSIPQPCVHRLDQTTGGLMVLGLTEEAHRKLSSDFENHNVEKEYIALIDGILKTGSGRIEMKIRPDIENRPYQIPDSVAGKEAVTEYQRIRVEKICGRFVTRVRFHPLTGRTHQIRLHAAEGLKMPVLNDSLYGKCSGEAEEGRNLCLYATRLSFNHPVTGEHLTFECEPDF